MNTSNSILIVIGIIVVFAIGGGISYLSYLDGSKGPQPGEYTEFAQCVAASGTTFFGAFWCPHCQNQKAMFGDAADLLPYVECSTPDGQGRLQECIDANIQSYPTWEFADKTRVNGEISFADLSAKTGCPLPNATAPLEQTNIDIEPISSSSPAI